MRIRAAKKYENLWTKVLAIIAMCGLGVGLVFSSYFTIRCYQAGLYSDIPDYLESQNANDLSYSAVSNIIYGYDRNEDISSYGFNCNYSFNIYENDGSSFREVYKSKNVAKEYITKVFYVHGSELDFELVSGAHIEMRSEDENDFKYRVEIHLYDPPVLYYDAFYQGYQFFNNFYGMRYLFIFLVILFMVLMLLDLVFLLASAGYDSNYEGLNVTVMDRIPYDLYSFVLLGAVMLLGKEIFSVWNHPVGSWPYQLVLLIIAGLLLLMWLVSTAVRIKNGSLYRNTLLFYCLDFFYELFANARFVWKVIVIALGYAIIYLYTFDSSKVFLFVIASFVLASYVIYWCIQADKVKRLTESIVNGELRKDVRISNLAPSVKKHYESISCLQEGISAAIAKEMKSERLKTELITNVSHDIKTPLTSIMNYIDLLKKKHTKEQEKEYLEVLSIQSLRLKKLTEDIVEASKASTGNVAVNYSKICVNELLGQSLTEYQERFKEAKLEVITNVPEKDIYVRADGNLFWRILNNLYSNLCKYSMENTRVYIDVAEEDDKVRISLKNISKDSLNINPDELMERFVRGDSSRHTDGSGLGLNIARSLTELQKAVFSLSIDGDLFKVDLVFDRAD